MKITYNYTSKVLYLKIGTNEISNTSEDIDIGGKFSW